MLSNTLLKSIKVIAMGLWNCRPVQDHLAVDFAMNRQQGHPRPVVTVSLIPFLRDTDDSLVFPVVRENSRMPHLIEHLAHPLNSLLVTSS